MAHGKTLELRKIKLTAYPLIRIPRRLVDALAKHKHKKAKAKFVQQRRQVRRGRLAPSYVNKLRELDTAQGSE